MREELAELRDLVRSSGQDQAALLEDSLQPLEDRLKRLEAGSRPIAEQLATVQAALETAKVAAAAEAKASAERAAQAEAAAGAITQRVAGLGEALKQASTALQQQADGLHAAAERSAREQGASLQKQGAELHAALVRTAQESGAALQQQVAQLQAPARTALRLGWFIAVTGIAGWATALVLFLRGA